MTNKLISMQKHISSKIVVYICKNSLKKESIYLQIRKIDLLLSFDQTKRRSADEKSTVKYIHSTVSLIRCCDCPPLLCKLWKWNQGFRIGSLYSITTLVFLITLNPSLPSPKSFQHPNLVLLSTPPMEETLKVSSLNYLLLHLTFLFKY
jgi:hypothetical protein